MGLYNRYITRQEYLAWQTTQAPSSNVLDDPVIDTIIEAASRFIDNYTERQFYPEIDTKVYDTPSCYDLWLENDDLLEVTTLTNGDSEVITSTYYLLYPPNKTPYNRIAMKKSSTYFWETNSDGVGEQAISVLGVWGFHDRYSKAWRQVTTLSSAMTDTTGLAVAVTAATSFGVGSIIKIDSEIMNVSVVSTGLTVDARGDNGSTAATHLISAPVYIWQPVAAVKQACYVIVHSMYRKRFGENTASDAIMTAGGVLVSPKEVPAGALQLLQPYMRLL